jgi:hypothetical protein
VWHWIIGSLVFLRREHPRFLAAASWYCKGLPDSVVLDKLCCFWRVIERVAFSYADKSKIAENDRGKAKPCVTQLIAQLFQVDDIPEAMSSDARIGEIMQLRNDLWHVNIPITGEVIDRAAQHAATEDIQREGRDRPTLLPLGKGASSILPTLQDYLKTSDLVWN